MKSAAEVINDTIDPEEDAANYESDSGGASAGESEREVTGAGRGKKSKRTATVFIAEANSERKEGIGNGQ